MGDPAGFLKHKREEAPSRPVRERVKDFRSVAPLRALEKSIWQTARCMDCGTPFCHWVCPLANYIPEWNDLASAGQWERAYRLLSATNDLPEITARVCPAPCEYACVLGIHDDPVTIRENELAIIERAFALGLVVPVLPARRTGKKVAVIGSGPAGLSCAARFNKEGHTVTVFERDDKIGGILRYGIPNFKLEKWIIDRRVEIFRNEGIEFVTGVSVGRDLAVEALRKSFDAVCLAGGSRVPRDLNIEGRDLQGIHFAMDYLTQTNRRESGEVIPPDRSIHAKGKKVVVIGGGDTGADCVGTAHRQGASSIVQIEILPKPPERRNDKYPWPSYPVILKTSSSHEEGGTRLWSVLTKRFLGKGGKVERLSCAKVEFLNENSKPFSPMKEVPGSSFEIEADLVLIAMGFVHPETSGLLEELGVELDERGNVKTDESFMTSVEGIFAAGDMKRGQSLVVWAVADGRGAAIFMDSYLRGK